MKRWIVPAFALLCLSRSGSAQDPPPTYPVGSHPWDMVVGDFNNDGRPDLAVANSGGTTVSVLLGKVDGTFEAARSAEVGSHPYAVLTGDLNGDGNADLVTGGLNVLLGNGDGTFQPPATVVLPLQSLPAYFGIDGPQAQNPDAAALGDLSGDGRLDLVVAGEVRFDYYVYDFDSPYYNYTVVAVVYGYLNVLLGNGDGTFGPAAVEDLGEGGFIQGLALGDFDHDGRVDVASDGPSVRLGNGDGTLRAPRGSSVGAALMHVSMPARDFDRDGRLDLLMQEGNSAVVLRGNGDGTFQGADIAPVGCGIHSAVVGDVNGDGKLDIVVMRSLAEYATRSAVVLLGHGNGTFDLSAAWDLSTFAGNVMLTAAVLADLDGDGLPELAASNYLQNAVVVAHNPGSWPRPSPSIRIDDVTVTEGDVGTTPAVFTVRLLAPYDQEVAVDYSILTGYGLADEGSDIVATSGTVRFAPGEMSKTIIVEVVGDRLFEFSEAFHVVLANATPNASIADGWGYGTILDNDRIDVRISDVARPEGRSGTTPFVFTVALSKACGAPVTVYFNTLDGTAKVAVKKGSTSDYVATSGSLVFAAGQTSRTITVQATGDGKAEANETFFVRLSYAVNAFLLDDSGLATIVNDD